MDYQYEILKMLANEGQRDVAYIMNQLIPKNISDTELVDQRNNLAIAILNLHEEKEILTNFSPNTGLFKYFDRRIWMQEREGEFDTSDADKKISINVVGMSKLKTLKELYDPTPPQPTYSAIFHKEFKGNFNQGNSENLHQESLQEEGFKSSPTITPAIKTKTKHQKSLWDIISKTFMWLMNHIIHVIIALLIAYLVYRLGWNH